MLYTIVTIRLHKYLKKLSRDNKDICFELCAIDMDNSLRIMCIKRWGGDIKRVADLMGKIAETKLLLIMLIKNHILSI